MDLLKVAKVNPDGMRWNRGLNRSSRECGVLL